MGILTRLDAAAPNTLLAVDATGELTDGARAYLSYLISYRAPCGGGGAAWRERGAAGLLRHVGLRDARRGGELCGQSARQTGVKTTLREHASSIYCRYKKKGGNTGSRTGRYWAFAKPIPRLCPRRVCNTSTTLYFLIVLKPYYFFRFMEAPGAFSFYYPLFLPAFMPAASSFSLIHYHYL